MLSFRLTQTVTAPPFGVVLDGVSTRFKSRRAQVLIAANGISLARRLQGQPFSAASDGRASNFAREFIQIEFLCVSWYWPGIGTASMISLRRSR